MRTWFLVLSMPVFAFSSLQQLEEDVARDLQYLNYPPQSWHAKEDECLEVAIVGAGMAGIATAFALKQLGIGDVELFDSASCGEEGPWLTCARMETLRSAKELTGPALGVPSLTFRAWYEAQCGGQRWSELYKIPTQLWGRYLQWLKKILALRVHNCRHVAAIMPHQDRLMLQFDDGSALFARKVVLATGRAGFGGLSLPQLFLQVPKHFWAHSGEKIDNSVFRDKTVIVIGSGASAFDAAATALENDAKEVRMLMRREQLSPSYSGDALLNTIPFRHAYYFLSDAQRASLFCSEWGMDTIPEESLQRVAHFPQFFLMPHASVQSVDVRLDGLVLHLQKEDVRADFVVLATGYDVDGFKQKELKGFVDHILLWQDKVPSLPSKLGRFPYLGPFFEFLERIPGTAPYLQNIHCLQYGAFLSHGRITGEVEGVEIAARRVAEGIAVALFQLYWETRQSF